MFLVGYDLIISFFTTMHNASDFFYFPDSLPFSDFFCADVSPWKWVPRIKDALVEFPSNTSTLERSNSFHITGNVFIHPSVNLPAYGSIEGPAYIGEGCELRPGVYIRGNVIAGMGCVLGNSCEFKNSLLLENVQVPHFSYVGDSILGNGAHLGAGVICSNLRIDKGNVPVILPDGTKHCSGLRKLGALVGDHVEVGCNSVLNPGSMLGRHSLVLPGTSFNGTLTDNTGRQQ